MWHVGVVARSPRDALTVQDQLCTPRPLRGSYWFRLRNMRALYGKREKLSTVVMHRFIIVEVFENLFLTENFHKQKATARTETSSVIYVRLHNREEFVLYQRQ